MLRNGMRRVLWHADDDESTPGSLIEVNMVVAR
jgi:hypothetical protein